jgi:homoserine kinase
LNEVHLRVPATIANVGPGFDIFAFSMDGPADEFRIRLKGGRGGITIRFFGDGSGLPVDPAANTAGVAAARVLSRLDSAPGVEIDIEKGIPSCAGLGSSAASAVAAACGLDRLLGMGLSQSELLEAARQGEIASGGTAHADNVSACLLGGFIFLRGQDPLDAVRLELPDLALVLRVMTKAEQTTRGRIPSSFALADVKKQMAMCAEVLRAVAAGDAEAFGRAVNHDLISEPVRSRVIPGYAELKARVLEAGAWGCNVSGGGSSMFAVCPPGRAPEIAAVFQAAPLPDNKPAQVFSARPSRAGVRFIDGLSADRRAHRP